MSLPSSAARCSGSVIVSDSTTSAQPGTVIGCPTGAAVARSIQCRYAGLSSSGFWCSAVGYSQKRGAATLKVAAVLAQAALADVDDLLALEQRVDDRRPTP